MPVPQKRRGDMTREERQLARRMNKRAAYLRKIGKPIRITPEEFADIKRHVVDCHQRGMSFSEMGAQTGVVRHAFGDLINGRRKSLNRDTYERMLTLRYVAPDGITRHGSHLDPTGIVRRIEALRALHFPLNFVADQLGVSPQNIRYIGDYRNGVHLATRTRIEEVYEKYRDRKPEEFGYGASTLNRMRTIARKHGFAPPSCWDEDTIDDPDAAPEWTGACGTEEGYRVHIRESLAGNHLPLCEPCKAATEVVRDDNRGAPFEFLSERFAEALKERGINPRQLCIKLGRNPKEADRFYRWLKGDRQPKNRTEVYAVAAGLDLEPGELMRDLADGEGARRIGQKGGFNPFVLRAVADATGMTQREVGAHCGVSDTTVAKWYAAEHSPKDKATIKPFADALGLDVEIFYS